MSEPVDTIRNLGPATAEAFARAGIKTAEQVRNLGTDSAYSRLLAAGERPHFIAYYALEMGLQGRPWNDCTGSEKVALRRRFDRLKASAHDEGRSKLETALDNLGVVTREPRQPTSSSPEKK